MLGGVAIADNMSTDVCVANFCPAAVLGAEINLGFRV